MVIRVAVADDSLLVREGIETLLASAENVEIVGSSGDLDGLNAVVDDELPQVVVTDIRMPPTHTMEGIQIAARLRETHPDVGVVVLSQYADPGYVLRLFDSGSDGRAYLLKERVHRRRDLVEAIEAVAEGRSVIDPKIVEVLIGSRAQVARSPVSRLSPRQREILGAMAEGKSNAAIADTFVLTKRAVEKHVSGIFLKLGFEETEESDAVSKRVAAVLMYLTDESPSQ
ncbi:MAG: response regulator [Nocardioidaceae bacterium]